MAVASRARAIEEALKRQAKSEEDSRTLSLSSVKLRNNKLILSETPTTTTKVVKTKKSKKVGGGGRRWGMGEDKVRRYSGESVISEISSDGGGGGGGGGGGQNGGRRGRDGRRGKEVGRRSKNVEEIKLDVGIGRNIKRKRGDVDRNGDSPRSIVLFSPISQSPCSSNSNSDVSVKSSEGAGRIGEGCKKKVDGGHGGKRRINAVDPKRRVVSKRRDGAARKKKKGEVDFRAVGEVMDRLQKQGNDDRKDTVRNSKNVSSLKRRQQRAMEDGVVTRKDSKLGISSMVRSPSGVEGSRESKDFTRQLKRNSSRLPKAKVIIARRKPVTKDAGRLDSDDEDRADPDIAPASALPSTRSDECKPKGMTAVKTRKLITEYEDPRELRRGRVSLIDLMTEAGSEAGDVQSKSMVPSTSRIGEGELADIIQIDDDSRLLDYPNMISRQYQPGMDRRIPPPSQRRNRNNRYDDFFDAEELNSRMELLMRDNNFKSAAQKVARDKKPLPKRKRRLFRFLRSSKQPVEQEQAYNQERQVAVRRNDYTARSARDRRSSFMSGAIGRVSMACDPFIEFMAGRESVQVSGAIPVPSPVGWFRRRFFQRRPQRRNAVARIMPK